MSLPTYDDLLARTDAPAGSSWGVWPGREAYGCLNNLSHGQAREAAKLVRRGVTFSLNWGMELPDPPLFGRSAARHEVLAGNGFNDDILHGWNTQSSSQWDGLRHIPSNSGQYYGGLPGEEHGVHHWARTGIVGRAILADVARFRASRGDVLQPDQTDVIGPDELAATLEWAGVEQKPGDILLLRTGWIGWYDSLDHEARRTAARRLRTPGIAASHDMMRWLWDHRLAALGTDVPAVEAWPPPGFRAPGQPVRSTVAEDFDNAHAYLVPLLGLPLGEFWDLEQLASDCQADGIYEGMFTSAPINLNAGTASPANALVIK